METVPNEVVDELRIVHGLSERDAASLVMTVMGVATLTLKPAVKKKSGLKCPFRQPDFRMAASAPCPVCGVTSSESSAAIRAACVDP